jgi:choline dehydrogenase-like flavoprotein
MRLQPRNLGDSTLDTDLCIVGAGPAGLVLAAGMIAGGRDVILVESGGDPFGADESAGGSPAGIDPADLNDGDCLGDPYVGLRSTRHRGLGGTTGIWNTPVLGAPGAKYAPLDPVDVEPRPGQPLSGWPIPWSELAPWYEVARRSCGLPDTETAPDPTTIHGVGSFRIDCVHLSSDVYRLGSRDALIEPKIRAIDRAGNVRVLLRSTVLRLNASRGRVTSAAVAVAGGPGCTVRARRFVLAGGAIENARLLLSSDPAGPGLGNESGWVGRGFMEHPRDRSLSFRPPAPAFFADAGFYDEHAGPGGARLVGRLAIRSEFVRAGEVLNASATIFPQPRGAVSRVRRGLGPLVRFHALDRLLPRGGHGWSRQPGASVIYDRVSVLLNLEQSPHPENRVVLGTRRDHLGVKVPVLHWHWRAEDQARLEILRTHVAAGLEAAGLGPVSIDRSARVDPNAHHHAGTTRMSEDPSMGVVDASCRVHTLENLFVSGASVFPTSGYANPVLTIVALAARLASHLAEES